MKKIIVTRSASPIDRSLGNNEYRYAIQYEGPQSHPYMYTATEEGYMMLEKGLKLLGEVDYISLKSVKLPTS